MDNILDILYEYSKQGKIADRTFMFEIIKIIRKRKHLEDYITKVVFKDINCKSTNHKDFVNVPMAYSMYDKQILLDEVDILYFIETSIRYYDKFKKETNNLERILFANSMVLHALLHEIEHANQIKKVNNNDFESKLIYTCLKNELDAFKKSKLAVFLMSSLGIYSDKNLENDIDILNDIEYHYDTLYPTERMANIYAILSIRKMVDKIKGEIPFSYKLLANMEKEYLLLGYKYKDSLTYPTMNFIHDLTNSDITWTDELINEDFYKSLESEKNSPLKKRLTLGIDITLDEYNKIKNNHK